MTLEQKKDLEDMMNFYSKREAYFINEEKEEQTKWEFFLHKVYDKSWKTFCDDLEISNNTKKVDLGETLIKSKNMLNNFTPT